MFKPFFLFLMAFSSLSAMAQTPATLETLAKDLRIAQKKYNDKSGFAPLLYTLNLEPTIEKPYLKGEAIAEFVATADALEEVVLALHSGYKVAKIDGAGSFEHKDNILTIRLKKAAAFGEKFSFTIFYEGEPQLVRNGSIAKGLRWEKHATDQPIIANLSTPFLAHLWFPCKDGPSGKIWNGVNVNITVPDTLIGGTNLVGVGNGVLRDVVRKGKKLTYKWEHKFPIVPYYVMMAVSNYKKLQQDYTDPLGNKFPLEYFVFDEHVADAQKGTADMPKVMDFFTNVFGEYPYAKEKYGMTQLGFYSGIENQTNAIVNNMGPAKFYTSVHELAHMWFADAITCGTWQHGWLNEGFASYSEALWDEHAFGKAKYVENMMESSFYEGGSLLLEPTDNPFKVFVPSIYNKGQWTVHMLRGVVGDKVFFQSLKEYAQDARFKHGFATTEDLQGVFEKNHKASLKPFFEEWVYGEMFPKYTTNYTQDKKSKDITLRLDQEKLATKPAFFTMPLEVQLTFEDGTSKMERVENNMLNQTFTFKTDKVLKSVKLDPNEWVLKQISTETYNKGTKKAFQLQALATGEKETSFTLLSPKKQDIALTISDLTGKILLQKQLEKVKGSFEQKLALELKPGRYNVQLSGADTNILKQITVQRSR
jgi:aminopeptidase N